MPSPHKDEHERASRSLRALKPTLKKKPVSVTPVDGYDDVTTGQHAHQLRQLLRQHGSLPNQNEQEIPQRRIPRKDLPSAEESAGIIQHQSGYIRQLEAELRLCQGELATYKVHLNDVLDENARLISSQQTSQILKDVLQTSQAHQASSSGDQPATKQALAKHIHDLELLRNLHSSKTAIMEQQLNAAKEQQAAAERKAEEYKSQLLMQESYAEYDVSRRRFGGLCLRCGQREALIASEHDAGSLISQLYEEKESMIETLANMKRLYSDMQERESEAIRKVKAGINLAEQANLEKTQALVQREQLSEELSLLRQKLETIVENQKTSLANSKNAARAEIQNELTELERRLNHAVQAESELQSQLERFKREKDDLNNEVTKHKQQLSIYQSCMVESTTGRKIDLTQLACERDMAVEERNKLKNRLIKAEQVKDEAILRVKQELEDVRDRLNVAERELLQSREDLVKLTKENQSLDKQLNQVKMAYNSIDRSRNDELVSLTHKLENREEELQRLVTDTESRYGKQLMELENMYVAQNKLLEQLRKECTNQADIIQQVSSKYKNENKQLKHDNHSLSRQLEKCRSHLSNLETHGVEHEAVHKKLRSKLSELDDENRSLTRRVNELISECSQYKREIDILAGEVKFLRCHKGEDNPSPSDRMNSSMVDEILEALKSDMVNQDANLVDSIDIVRQVTKS